MTYNWNRTIGQYIEALESGDRIAGDAAALELMHLASYLNKINLKYPDKIKETPAAVVYLNDWKDK